MFVMISIIEYENCIFKWTALIPIVVDTVSVSMELVFARRVGKEMIVVDWMRKPVNVFLIVQEMVDLI